MYDYLNENNSEKNRQKQGPKDIGTKSHLVSFRSGTKISTLQEVDYMIEKLMKRNTLHLKKKYTIRFSVRDNIFE